MNAEYLHTALGAIIEPPLLVTESMLRDLQRDELKYPRGDDPKFLNYTKSEPPDKHHRLQPTWAGILHETGPMFYPCHR